MRIRKRVDKMYERVSDKYSFYRYQEDGIDKELFLGDLRIDLSEELCKANGRVNDIPAFELEEADSETFEILEYLFAKTEEFNEMLDEFITHQKELFSQLKERRKWSGYQ